MAPAGSEWRKFYLSSVQIEDKRLEPTTRVSKLSDRRSANLTSRMPYLVSKRPFLCCPVRCGFRSRTPCPPGGELVLLSIRHELVLKLAHSLQGRCRSDIRNPQQQCHGFRYHRRNLSALLLRNFQRALPERHGRSISWAEQELSAKSSRSLK